MKHKNNETIGSWTIYRWILQHIRPYRVKMTVIIGCGFIASFGELVTPLLIQRLVDSIAPNQNKLAYFQMLGLMAAIFSVILLCNVLRNSLQTKVSANAARDLQFGALQHLRKLGFAYYEQNPVGETLSLMNQQVHSAESIIRRFFPEIVQQLLFLTTAAGLLLYQSVFLSLIIVPCFLAYYLFGPKIDRKVSEASRRMQEVRIDYDKKIYESVTGAREYRAFGAEEWDIDRSRSKFNKLERTVLSWVYYIHLRWSVRSLLFQIGSIAIFITGYYLIKKTWMTAGQFIAFLLIYGIFMQRLSWLVSQFIEQNMLLQQVTRLYKLVSTVPSLEEHPSPVKQGLVKGELSFDNVHFSYPGRTSLLKGITLHIRQGERIAIVGTSGNGKSTLLKLMARFYDPTQGSILLDGIPLTQFSFRELRDNIGYVFQDTFLFGSTIRENIRFGNPDAADKQIEEAAIAANAHGFISELQDGYESLVGERGVKLSGGQKQRIAIARMLIKDPQILLLDEATSALDNVSENAVVEALLYLLAGRTTIAVAHRLSTVVDYDRIVVLDEGVIVEQGTYHELMAKRSYFYRLAEGEAHSATNAFHASKSGGDPVVLS
jgi:ATP-binding cassette, subfamily B, bacterial